MKAIEALVTDLETSKALQEAGIKYETAFVWVQSYLTKEWELTENSPQFRRPIPAFTASELMQLLPDMVEHKNILSKSVFVERLNGVFTAGYADILHSLQNGKSSKEALSKLCLWCRKEGYL